VVLQASETAGIVAGSCMPTAATADVASRSAYHHGWSGGIQVRVKVLSEVVEEVLKKTNCKARHQLAGAASGQHSYHGSDRPKNRLSMDNVIVTCHAGNTSAASIPLAWIQRCAMVGQGRAEYLLKLWWRLPGCAAD